MNRKRLGQLLISGVFTACAAAAAALARLAAKEEAQKPAPSGETEQTGAEGKK